MSTTPQALAQEVSRLYQLQDHASIYDLYRSNDFHNFLPESLLVIGASLLASGKYSDSVQLCEALYPLSSRESSFYQVYGSSLRKSGAYLQASHILEEGLTQYPGDPFIINNYANSLIDLNRLSEAETLLQRLSTLKPPVPNLLDVQENLKRVSLLKSLSGSFATSGPIQQEYAADPLQRAFNKDELEMSKERLDTASLESIRYKLAKASQLTSDDQSKALQLLKVCSETASEFPGRVLKDLNMISRYHSNLPALYETAGDCYLALQQYADAEIAYHSALHLGSQSTKVIINLSNLVLLRGDKNLCIILVKRIKANSLTSKHEQQAYQQIISNLKQNSGPLVPFQIPSDQHV